MSSGENPEQTRSKQYGQMIAKAWADPAFKARLLAEPEQVIREQGIALAAGQRLTAVEVGPRETYIVLAPDLAHPETAADDPWGMVRRRVAMEPAYREKLLRTPAIALAEARIEVPAGQIVRTVEADDAHGYVFVPTKPEGLSEEAETDDVAGYFFNVLTQSSSGSPTVLGSSMVYIGSPMSAMTWLPQP